ncbi:hypothetical protein ACOSQ3_020187 [Xanthoceras sorbifolium]
MAKVLQLKQQLQNTKKGSLSISNYFLKVKTLGDALRAAGQTVTEYNMVISALSELGHDYDVVVVLLSSQHQSVSMQEAQYLLMAHEQRLDQLNYVSQVEIFGASTHYATNTVGGNNSRGGSQSGGRGSNQRGGRGRGRSGRWNNNKISCQVCGKTGHGALQCYRRFDQTWQGFSQQNNNTNQSGQNSNQQVHYQPQPHYNNFSQPQAHFHQ